MLTVSGRGSKKTGGRGHHSRPLPFNNNNFIGSWRMSTSMPAANVQLGTTETAYIPRLRAVAVDCLVHIYKL